ncbi:Uncharacterised protein (plasmid) [Tsukamurella tyrosinosolvens]|uniref:Uncharacterized protein n=2 Tax=Tsukamurella tyrosinosolvens TaxID=57704 RepID=A0A1H4WKI6_TSUTY|nr:hypothetical protein SAMN04489793_3573 [Tsukamurella tyrosinosolvens]VEH89373.1 Uncharacterised protein [Tsukamurella tyrosinosolvens]
MSILTVRWQVRFDDGDPLVELAYLPVPFLSDREFLRLTPAERRRFFDLALRVVDTMPTTTVFDELCRDRLLATAAAAGL